jgi:hypothetical protein
MTRRVGQNQDWRNFSPFRIGAVPRDKSSQKSLGFRKALQLQGNLSMKISWPRIELNAGFVTSQASISNVRFVGVVALD